MLLISKVTKIVTFNSDFYGIWSRYVLKRWPPSGNVKVVLLMSSFEWRWCNLLAKLFVFIGCSYISLYYQHFKENLRGSVLPSNRFIYLMGMCHWLGSHQFSWEDDDGVGFSRVDWPWWGCIFNSVTRRACTFWGFWGKKILKSRDLKMERVMVKSRYRSIFS